MESIDSIETYAYGTSKDPVSEKEDIKCNNIIKRYKMINFGVAIKENIKEHNPNIITDNPYIILIIGVSGSGKANSLFNPISEQPDIDKIYLYAKDLYEAKF